MFALRLSRPASSRSFSTSAFVPAEAFKVVVVGAGTAGITVTAQLQRACRSLKAGDIAILDPSVTHHYQPGWTLVGSGLAHLSDLSKPLVDVIPSGATHIPEAVETFHPEKNMVVTKGGLEIT